MPWTLTEIAAQVGGTVVGDGTRTVTGVRTLDDAGTTDLSFVSKLDYRAKGLASRAGALLVPAGFGEADRPLIVAEQPSLALAKLLEVVYPPPRAEPGVHATAMVGEGAQIDASASIGPYAVIGTGTRVGARARIGPHAVIGADCSLGPDVVLHPHVVLYDGTELGARVMVHAGSVLGADGFGYAFDGSGHVKIPQVGITVLEDDVEVGALSTIDRALLAETRIGAGSKIDNLVQVGHNVTTGRGCLLCGQAGVAGTARLGNFVVLAGQAGIVDHMEVGDGVQIAAKAAVMKSVASGQVAGVPAKPIGAWRRQVVALDSLGALRKRVRSLERRLEAAEAASREPDS